MKNSVKYYRIFQKKEYIGLLLAIMLLICFLITGVFWLVSLHPINHFHSKKLPLLAVPTFSNQGNFDLSPKALPKIGFEQSFHSPISQSFNILILGIDARDTNPSRADMIMVVNINPLAKTVNLVSIPRDARIAVAGIGYTKINHTHLLGEMKGGNLKGTQASLNAVANLLLCNLNYYVKVDFQGFKNFIDTLGGLDIRLPDSVKLTFKSITLPAGNNHLNGDMTLELTRERYSLKNGDFGRQRNQLLVLKAIAKQMMGSDITRLSESISQASKNVVDTNLTNADLLSLAWLLRQVPEGNLNYYQIRGESEYGLDPLTKTVVYYWKVDMEDIKRIQKHFQ